jgi:hypothetical protein
MCKYGDSILYFSPLGDDAHNIIYYHYILKYEVKILETFFNYKPTVKEIWGSLKA